MTAAIAKAAPQKQETVNAEPVKSFFVTMLTRDIKLEEAILDLLDNCVDGILRAKKSRKGAKTPYDGFWAKITYDKDTFSIEDNCGGIPEKSLKNYAFRMGRADDRQEDPAGTVGVYGIGMKRAIFKMGEKCLVTTEHDGKRFEVRITPDWIRDENNWRIPVNTIDAANGKNGTSIAISALRQDISSRFSDDEKSFTAKLVDMVATHYAFIIAKGFRVCINGKTVSPCPTRLIFTKRPIGKKGPAIRPFIFKAELDGVKVYLTVGFTRPIPSQADIEDEQREKRYSSIDAGWTVICNDRAVLYCDRSELTGWGEAGVPRYHTQFIAISGVVEFICDEPDKLPTTTTKRGMDASSRLYLQVKNKMREGMQLFTDYTNKWKGRADESKSHIDLGEPMSFEEIKHEAQHLTFRKTTQGNIKGHQYKPSLPLPESDSRKRRISFAKDAEDVKRVASYLLNDEEADPSEVGEKCFDAILKEARK